MSAYTISRTARWALLPLVAAALGACTADDPGDRIPAETAPAPVVQGLGGASGEPAMADTIDLRKIGYTLGEEDAPVTVYEFSDFGCPYCGKFARETFASLHEEFVATGKVRWTYVPVTLGFPGGRKGARAAECAAEQGGFWAMHDLLYENQSEWKASQSAEQLAGTFAARIGLDADRFSACYREDRGAGRTAVHNRAAEGLRVRATPSFFVNGRLVEGALPAEHFRQVLNALSGER